MFPESLLVESTFTIFEAANMNETHILHLYTYPILKMYMLHKLKYSCRPVLLFLDIHNVDWKLLLLFGTWLKLEKKKVNTTLFFITSKKLT